MPSKNSSQSFENRTNVLNMSSVPERPNGHLQSGSNKSGWFNFLNPTDQNVNQAPNAGEEKLNFFNFNKFLPDNVKPKIEEVVTVIPAVIPNTEDTARSNGLSSPNIMGANLVGSTLSCLSLFY